MSRNLKILFVVLSLGLLAWYFTRPNDSELIKERVDKTLAPLNYLQEEFKLVEALALSGEFVSNFAESTASFLNMESERREIHKTRKDIKEGFLTLKRTFCEMKIELSSLDIKIQSESAAVVNASAKLLARDCGREDFFQEIHPIKIILNKVEGNWLDILQMYCDTVHMRRWDNDRIDIKSKHSKEKRSG